MAIPISDSPARSLYFLRECLRFWFYKWDHQSHAVGQPHLARLGSDGGVVNDQVVIVYLRGNILAAISLRQVLDNALLLAAPTPEMDGEIPILFS